MTTMSLDTTALVDIYKPFQPANSQGWNWDSGATAYFVSQGSEYKQGKPGYQAFGGAPSAAIRGAIIAFGTFASDLLAQSDDPAINQKGADILAWANSVAGGAAVDQLSVPYPMSHIRGNSIDDEASVVLSYVFCPPLGCPILVQNSTTIDWADTAEQVSELITLFGAADSTVDQPVVTGKAVELFELTTIGSFLLAWSVAVVALEFIRVVGRALLENANDGGRANFIAVLTHATQRVSAAVRPMPPGSGSFPSVNPDLLNTGWYNTQKDPSVAPMGITDYQQGVFFGSYPGGVVMWEGLQKVFVQEQPFGVGMPELSWGAQGATMLASTKVYGESESEEVYTIVMLLFSGTGDLLAVSSLMQSGASAQSIVIADPPWVTADDLGGYQAVVDKEITSLGLFATATVQLEYVIPQLIGLMADATHMLTGDWLTAPQPRCGWSVSWSGFTNYDSGGVTNALAIRSDGVVIECHGTGSNNSKLYWHYGTVNSSGVVSWNGSGGTYYQTGDWPSLSVQPGSSGKVLEIHNGGGNDNLYWTDGDISTNKISFDSSGTSWGGGDHPAQCMGSDGVVVEMHLVGGNELYTTVADYTGWSLTANRYAVNIDYHSGDYPTLARTGNQIIEVHHDDGKIWYNVLTLNSDQTLSHATNPFPFTLKGMNPHVVVDGQKRVVATYDDDDGTLYYAVGELQGGLIRWHLLNGEAGLGGSPAIALTPSGHVLMASIRGSTMQSCTGTITPPN